jgi:hypothetical protein
MEPGEEELLPQPRSHQDGARPQWLRRDLGIGVLVLLAAALIADAVSKHGGSLAGPSPSASSHTFPLSAATDFVTLVPTGAAYLPKSAAEAVSCPPHADCVVRHVVSPPIHDALVAAFPGAVIISAEAVRMTVPNFGSANWSLQIRAHVDDEEIQLHARGLALSDRTRGYSRLIYSGRAIARYEGVLGPYYVLIQVVTPADQHASARTMARLASDNRLYEPW